MTDVPVDVGEDAVVITMSVETLRIDTSIDLVIDVLTGGLIVFLIGVVIGGLVNGMIRVGVDMLDG